MTLTNRTKFYKKHNIPLTQSLSLKEISALSKMPIKALQEVYNRGIGAHKTNLQSVRLKTGEKNVTAPASRKMSPEQWAFGCLYSFVMKQPTTYGKSDADIRIKYKV
jgi:hypothetical protein